MSKLLKNFLAVAIIFVFISAIFALSADFSINQKIKNIPLNQVAKAVSENEVKDIKVTGDILNITYKNGQKATSRKEPSSSLIQSLINYGVPKEKIKNLQVEIEKEPTNTSDWLIPLLSFVLPLLIFIWFFGAIFKQAKSGTNQTFSFLKSPAKLFGTGKTPGEQVTFKDVADLEEAKKEIKEIIDFLRYPKKFWKIGARIPKGVLLIGPPGCGKTLLAKAVANEAHVPFFSMSGSEFIELFVGVGASRVRSLFETAKKHQPSIIFIDEIDSIGQARMPGFGGGHEEREQTLNQILAEMDGFQKNTGVIVFAATNRPQLLDPALLRPGRFDRRIVLELPDIKGREAIMKIHCRDKPLALDVNLREIAERTPGFSGADLANLVNEAAILAARHNKQKIYQEDFLESIEKVLLGPERKSHLLSKEEKEVSAFHEAGHALVTAFLAKGEQVRKVSIISRGFAAGYTLALPKTEKKIKKKSEFLADISILLGGYCAEKLKFGEISTGASNDLKKASALARDLVTKYGMSKLGPISFGKEFPLPFLGWQGEERERNYSEKIAAAIDKETERFIREAEKRTMKILTKKRKVLEKIAKTLIEKETIEKEEFEKLIKSVKTKKGSGNRKKKLQRGTQKEKHKR